MSGYLANVQRQLAAQGYQPPANPAKVIPAKVSPAPAGPSIGDFEKQQFNPTPVLNPGAGSTLPAATQPANRWSWTDFVPTQPIQYDFIGNERRLNDPPVTTPTNLISAPATDQGKLTPLIIAGIALKLLL